MKLRIEHADIEEAEIVIRCREIDEDVKRIQELIESRDKKLLVTRDKESYFVSCHNIYYFEYVDHKVFVYLKDQVYEIAMSLEKLEAFLEEGFFRCGKSMIINLDFIDKFETTMGNRIVATLENDEEVIISRHYAKQLRTYLRIYQTSSKL